MGGTGVTSVDGVRIHYRVAGDEGPPVVLLHGAGVDDAALSYREAIDRLAGEFSVYAPDWPGHGESDDDGVHSVERYREVLSGFLDDRGLYTPSLVGLSMGGAAALGYALENPDRVADLVLAASYGLGDRVPAGSLWYALAHTPGANTLGWNALGTSRAATRMGLAPLVYDVDALPEEFVESVQRRASHSDAGQAFAAFQRAEVAPDGTVATTYRDRLGDLSVPTLFVHGRHDRVFPAAWSERASERVPGSRLELLERCGHWIPRERPDRFGELLAEFCQPNRPVER